MRGSPTYLKQLHFYVVEAGIRVKVEQIEVKLKAWRYKSVKTQTVFLFISLYSSGDVLLEPGN